MKWKHGLIACFLIASTFIAYGQNSVGIGVANPNKNAVLELISPNNNQGLLIPKLTTAQRTATSFMGQLSATENGLMVFDSNEKVFYYWDATQWKAIGTGSELTQGDGITIINNTVSVIPQDLQLSGSNLTITNNPSATPIPLSSINIPQDIQLSGSNLTITNNPSATSIPLSSINIPQDIQLSGSNLTITNNPSATPIPLSSLNVPQDLQLVGSTLTITDNPSATPINLSAFTGTNTDDQTLTFNGGTGVLSISRLSGGPQTVTLPTSTPPSGPGGGDLSGTYPNPTIANNAINSAKIADASIANADIADNAINSIKIADGTVANGDIADNAINSIKIADNTITSNDINDGTIASADIGTLQVTNAHIATGVAVGKLAPGANGQFLTTAAGTTQWAAAPTATGTAGGDLTGTYPNPDIAANAVTSAEINDLTIVNNDISATAAIAVGKLGPGTNGQYLTTAAGVSQWAAAPTATGTAGGDLTGTYPNPTVNTNAITSAKIADLTIANADIAANAAVDVSKLAPSAVNGQYLTTAGGVSQWAAAPAASGTAGGDLTGTYPNPTVNTSAITSAKIADLTIANADIATNAAVDVSKLAPSAVNGQYLTTAGGVSQWAAAPAASGTAGGDLTGTFPSPQIAALTIVDGDISASAAIAVSKLAPSANAGFVLTTSGGIAQWAAPGAGTLISAPGTRNLIAGTPPAGIAGGTDNTTFGSSAGNAAITGSWNVYIGSGAGRNTIDGDLNTMVGWHAGNATPTAGASNGNAFFGAEAGANTMDGPNTFIGEKAGWNNDAGTHSVMVGNRAGAINTLGFQNTIIGSLANLSANNLNNATAIGYNTVVNASNKVRIGNTAVSVIEGQVAYTAASDRRLKTNILPFENGLDMIMKLKPVTYNMKNSSDTRLNWGFIAQDVEALVGTDNAVLTISGDKDRTLGLRYTDFVAPLVKAVQEQQQEIDQLNSKLSENEKKMAMLIAEMEKLKQAVGLKAENK